MITLITGTPGAGKTLYCISKLLRDLVGSSVTDTDPATGKERQTPRRILTNINGLLLDHELIDGSNTGGLANWPDWCKPGDVIVYDEVQRSWPPRPNGAKVPDDISGLETHRHRGVDFIIITQHPMLLDRNVRALVGRHLHVRRFGGIGAAIVYEWDHCSQSLMYSKSIAKAPWRYDKSVFQLYKSAELHTKPKTRVPTLAYVVIAAIAAAAYLVPNIVNRIASKTDQVQGNTATETQPGQKSPGAQPAKNQPAQTPPGQPPAHELRAPDESDNPQTQRIDLSDLVLTGYVSGPAGEMLAATWQWVKDGQVRYTFDDRQLAAQPLAIVYTRPCHAKIVDRYTKRERNYWCQPGIPSYTPQNEPQQPQNAPAAPLTTAAL